MNDQNAKADAGKYRPSIVPMRELIKDIAAVREYGDKKYGDTNSWQRVDRERYVDALGRHTIEFLDNPTSRDEESGLPHLWHIACNVAFLCEMYKEADTELLEKCGFEL